MVCIQTLSDARDRREAKKQQVAFDKEKQEAIRNGVRADFESGLSKADIMKKHGISSTTYVRYTTDLHNAKKEELKKKCCELRKSGMLVKDIANMLSLHRTTVTEYCKSMAR